MDFNRLKASIVNNADQKPSLYMALCMVESLISDVEDSCGTEISHCPVGDESLPTKLTWLCRIVNEIYKDNCDDFQRNRKRLDAAVEKLNTTKNELQELSGVADKLAALRAEYAVLEQKVNARRSEAEECEMLTARCAKARQQLEDLQQFSPAAAREELEKLNLQIASLESTKAGLSAQLQQVRLEWQTVQQEAEDLKLQNQDTQQRIVALKGQLSMGRDAAEQERAALAALKADCAALETERQQLTWQQDQASRELIRLRERVSNFQEEELVPAQIRLEVARQDVAGLEQSKEVLVQGYNMAKEQQSKLILEIASQKIENEALQEKLSASHEKLAKQKEEKQRLDTELNDCIQKLGALQETVEQLKNKKLPEALSLQQQEQTRWEELTQRTAQAESQCRTYKEEIATLETRLPKLEEDVKNDREVYDALTAKWTAGSKELESLERQIAELRSNSSEEKLEIYRKQLEENQRQLESVQDECTCILQEISQKEKELEAGQNERARLLELKRRHESGLEATKKQLQELEFAATEKYVREVTALEERVKLLETVRDKLTASLANMQRILGSVPIAEHSSLEEQFKCDLRELRNHIDDLRGALLECAKSLKLEER